MVDLIMPAQREYGWRLKETRSSYFEIHQRENGQFCVVLNHALLRGCTAEMLRWWFHNFGRLKVTLVDTPGYEGANVGAYLLWHPIDHHSAEFTGALAKDGGAQAGAAIKIREAMQYDVYGWRYPVDQTLKIFYVGPDGWSMGKTAPLLGPLMVLRIHFKDIEEAGVVVGVHYHYEVVIGLSAGNFIARAINRRLSGAFGPEFFEAWHRHNVIEVGVFENFLPALYAQRADPNALRYRLDMDSAAAYGAEQTGFDRALFDARCAAYRAASDPYSVQGYAQPSFL